ncbi:MAG: hypothetical protein R8G33_11505 [Gammaproteobacteria bacterium]|nr:hypothetical protein [Gammaproteobacteria bacterium]
MKSIKRGVPSFILVALFLVLISATSFADGSKVPPPKGDQCVEDPTWMRTNHFETVLHQRDDTVIRGIRTTKHSLKNCIDCHVTPNAEGEYARYSNSEEHFCASCHTYAAVTIDCFQCHADRPESAVREAIKQHAINGVNPHKGMKMSANELILKSSLLSTQ